MFTFEKTQLYQKTAQAMKSLSVYFDDCQDSLVAKEISKSGLELCRIIGELVGEDDLVVREEKIEQARQILRSMASDLNFAKLSDEDRNDVDGLLKNIELEVVSFTTSQKHILVLTAKMGHGHLSAAIATKEGLRSMYGYDYQVEVVDFLELLGSFMNKTTQKILLGSAKYTHNLNRFIYDSTDKEGRIKLLNLLNYPLVLKKVKKMFEEKKPDLIISTFPLWDHLILEVWRKSAMRTRFINIITDSINVHSYWTFAKPDFHIVANEETAEVVRKMGVPAEKVKPFGLPVRLKFMEQSDRGEFCQKYDLDPNKRYVLYLAMDDRVKIAVKNIEELLSEGCDVLVVAGRNKKLVPKLKEKIDDQRVAFFGWIDDLDQFMHHSDVVVTKAGGATVMEAIVTETPLIISSVLAGQEEGNAELIEKYDIGVVMPRKGGDLGEALRYIVVNFEGMKKRLAEISRPDASLEIARFIKDYISTS